MKTFKEYITIVSDAFTTQLNEAIILDPDKILTTLGKKVVKLEYSLDYGTEDSNTKYKGVPLIDGCTMYFEDDTTIFTHSNYWDDKDKVFDLMKKGTVKIKERKLKYAEDSPLVIPKAGESFKSKRGTLTIS